MSKERELEGHSSSISQQRAGRLLYTQEDRITALERKVAMLELLRSQVERKAEEALPPAQARTMKEINENLTILLGVTSSQGGDIKVIKEDASSIKDRLDRLETQSNEQTALLNEHS